MCDSKKDAASTSGYSLIVRFRSALEISYWAMTGLFLLAIFKMEIGIQLVQGISNATGGAVLQLFAVIPYVSIVAKARPDIPFAAQYVTFLYLMMFAAHAILLIAVVPRIRPGASGKKLAADDSYERYLLRKVYLFFPSLNIVSFLESLRSIFGSASDQNKQIDGIYARDIQEFGITPSRMAGYACLVAISFFVMPLMPGGFRGEFVSLAFSVYAGLMVLLQVNVLFELGLLLIVYFKKS